MIYYNLFLLNINQLGNNAKRYDVASASCDVFALVFWETSSWSVFTSTSSEGYSYGSVFLFRLVFVTFRDPPLLVYII